jgi:hypothetical protein
MASKDFAAIWAEAEAAGQKATEEYTAQYGYDGGSCGFAWITIRPARGAFVNWCKEQNRIATEAKTAEHGRPYPERPRGDSGWNGGWVLWRPGSTGYHGQSINVIENAARAFNAVLATHGIVGSLGSRLD